MKIQITKFSIHQTAKVFSILTFVVSLLMLIVMTILSVFFAPPGGMPSGPFGIVFFLVPVLQAIFAYVVMLLGCWLYNQLCRTIGGVEFEYEESQA